MTLISADSKFVHAGLDNTVALKSSDLLLAAGRRVCDWMRNRQFSLLSYAVDAVQQAKSMNSEVERVFGSDLTPQSIRFISKMRELSDWKSTKAAADAVEKIWEFFSKSDESANKSADG
jgi:hypothetical protein